MTVQHHLHQVGDMTVPVVGEMSGHWTAHTGEVNIEATAVAGGTVGVVKTKRNCACPTSMSADSPPAAAQRKSDK